jgi:hypothetical protein
MTRPELTAFLDQVTQALHAAAEQIAPEAWRRPNWERAIADARRKEGGR